MRRTALAFASLLLATGASAHDFWLQPRGWQATPGVPLPFLIEVGHGSFRQHWSVDRSHLLAFRDFGKGGSIDIRSLFRPNTPIQLVRTFQRPGLHIIALVSTKVKSDLPSIRFNDYIKTEGLTPAITARAQGGTSDKNGRELYSRRAKAYVEVAGARASDAALATRPIGMTLEIVPLKNPYALGNDRNLPVQIYFEGKPLAGALVKLTSLEFDERPLQSIRSDASGKAVFTVPPVGSWLVNVIWTKPIQSPDADFETTFSSLTFGYSAKR